MRISDRERILTTNLKKHNILLDWTNETHAVHNRGLFSIYITSYVVAVFINKDVHYFSKNLDAVNYIVSALKG